MSRSIVRSPAAVGDLIRCYAYLEGRGGDALADRFFDAVERTLALISKSPGIGTLHPTNHPRLVGLRSFPVPKFKRYILFYWAFDDRIELVRVLHGARDLPSILATWDEA